MSSISSFTVNLLPVSARPTFQRIRCVSSSLVSRTRHTSSCATLCQLNKVRTVQTGALDGGDEEYYGPLDEFADQSNAWSMRQEQGSRSFSEECSEVSDCEEGDVVVQDDMESMLSLLPADIRSILADHPDRAELLEVVLDLGRKPEARFLGASAVQFLREEEISEDELAEATGSIGEFGGDNRAGIPGTLHRISCMRNRRGNIVGLTCRVGRSVTGHVEMIRDLLEGSDSILFLGRPGVGKTTVIRELARVLSDELNKRVVIVDTSNEIGGDGDVPHPAIGGARRMQVADPSEQHRVMIEAVENHMPEVIIVDEIGTEAEALACRTIAERGVQLVGTAHGQLLENLIKNPTLSDLVGGVHTVTLGDEEARLRGTTKSVMERKAPPTFPVLLEMREREYWVAHRVEDSVDAVLAGKRPHVQVRTRDPKRKGCINVQSQLYDLDPSIGRSRAVSELEADAAFGLGSSGSGWGNNSNSSYGTDKEDPFSWAQRLGAVPDKDMLEDLALASYGGGGADRNRFSYTGNKGSKRGGKRRGGQARASRAGR